MAGLTSRKRKETDTLTASDGARAAKRPRAQSILLDDNYTAAPVVPSLLIPSSRPRPGRPAVGTVPFQGRSTEIGPDGTAEERRRDAKNTGEAIEVTTAAAIATALGHNFFLQPAVVKALVRYALVHRPILNELSYGRAQTLLDVVEDDICALATVFMVRPIDFELYGQVGVLTAVGRPPHTVAIYYWAGPAFGFTDELLVDMCKFDKLGTTLASLSQCPEHFWSNIRHAEMVSHIQASSFKYVKEFAASYYAPLWIAHLVRTCVKQVLVKLPEVLIVTDGLAVLRAMGRGLARATQPPTLSDTERAIITLLGQELSAANDFEVARQRVELLSDNLDALVLNVYERESEANRPALPLGDRPMPFEDLQALLSADVSLLSH